MRKLYIASLESLWLDYQQKKSRQESHGEGSGVEILVNEPYTDGPGPEGKGQYTRKVYHVGSHLPGGCGCKILLLGRGFILYVLSFMSEESLFARYNTISKI